jgi:hypothetical protein
MSSIRKAVVQEINRRGQSGYAFAKSMEKIHPVTIMKWLYSGHRVSLAIAERALDALDLVVVPKSKLAGNGKRKKK